MWHSATHVWHGLGCTGVYTSAATGRVKYWALVQPIFCNYTAPKEKNSAMADDIEDVVKRGDEESKVEDSGETSIGENSTDTEVKASSGRLDLAQTSWHPSTCWRCPRS